MNDLLVVIPALNEEKSIGRLLDKIIPKFNTLVVSDGSTDKTVEISESCGAKVLSFKNHKGYDKVINEGFSYAAANGYKKIITFDADGQHDVKDLSKIAEIMNEKNIDIVAPQRLNVTRISEKLFSWYTSKQLNVPDLLSGMKGYKINLFLEYGTFDTFSSIGTELSFFAIKKKFNYKLINIVTKKREDKPRFGGAFLSNLKIIRALLILMYKNSLNKI